MEVCRVDVAFHYLLRGDEQSADAMIAEGIVPLSCRPNSDTWKTIEREAPGVFEEIYDELARPALGTDYTHSGIFLTPIDFRAMPDLPLATVPRFRIAVTRLEPETSALSFVLDERRHSLRLTADNLEWAASIWSGERVREWFGKRPDRMFWFVPQIACYPDAPLTVSREEFEPAG